MNDIVKVEQVANPLEINKERLRAWKACSSGYVWFLEKFPQGGMFGEEALGEAGYRPVNADVTIVAQKPKLRPYIDQMRVHLARHMGVDVSQVSVKATTSEGMGFEGEEKGMTAHAVCLIESI